MVIVMWCVQTLKYFSFLVWRLCAVVCKHVENFKVPCVWVDLILKRLIIFGRNVIEIFYLYRRDFFSKNSLY